jgi:hypothetical protein
MLRTALGGEDVGVIMAKIRRGGQWEDPGGQWPLLAGPGADKEKGGTECR